MYSKLRGRIKEVLGSEKRFRQLMKMSSSTASGKLNGRTAFTQKDIVNACIVLEIDDFEIPSYFFGIDVRKYYQTQNKESQHV